MGVCDILSLDTQSFIDWGTLLRDSLKNIWLSPNLHWHETNRAMEIAYHFGITIHIGEKTKRFTKFAQKRLYTKLVNSVRLERHTRLTMVSLF